MTLADRIREVLNVQVPPRSLGPGNAPSGETREPAPTETPPEGLAEVLHGDWLELDRGRTFVVERRWTGCDRHGTARIDEWARQIERSSGKASIMNGGRPVAAPFVFFDLETTGLSGGAGTYAFLVGCGSFETSGDFVTRQFLLPGFAEEKPMLAAVAHEFSDAGTLVSFNGKSFDAPVLETRFSFHRLDWTSDRVPHLDVLHPARRFWGRRPAGAGPTPFRSGSWEGNWESVENPRTVMNVPCTLGALERDILGAGREADVPGSDIPERYFAYVRSKDARPLEAVLEHNRVDLLSLAGLTARLFRLVDEGSSQARNSGEALALGRAYARAGLDGRAREAFTRAVEMVHSREEILLKVGALQALARMERRGRRHAAAADRWAELLDVPGCPGHILREATEALAVHHEHRLRDFPGARAFALKTLAVEARETWQQNAQHRLARIERKLAGRTIGSLPFASSLGPPSPRPSAEPMSGPRTSS